MDSEVEKLIEEERHRRLILESILVHTITTETSRIPHDEEIILEALINSTVHHVNNEGGTVKYDHNYWQTFVDDAFKYFHEEMEKNPNFLTPKIKDALLLLIKPKSADVDARDTGYTTCEAYKHLKDYIGLSAVPRIRNSFPITYEMFANAGKFMQTLTPTEYKDIHTIGKIMRGYFDSRKK
jgi:hypothetical protein